MTFSRTRRHWCRHFILAPMLLGALGISTAATPTATPVVNKAQPTILVVGDSLSAEYGLKRGQGWVALLEKQLKVDNLSARVVNASISGDTTSGGVSRLAPLLAQHKPSHVIIELGGNDALRGLPISLTENNLGKMTQSAQKAGAKVLLLGMQVPPNYGGDYGARFADTFTTVAKTNKAAVVPFLLKGVADGVNPTEMFQNDRIHPKAEAHPIMLANVWPELKKLLK